MNSQAPRASGALLAKYATPDCLAPLSFRADAEMAKKYEDGYRNFTEVNCKLRVFDAIK